MQVLGDAGAEMSRFQKLCSYLSEEINSDEFDSGSLTQSLIVALRDGMAVVNPPYKKKLTDEELQQMKADEESNKKLGNIEIELEEIA